MSLNVNITRQTTAKTSPYVKAVSKPSSGTSESAICGKATYKVSPTEGGERIGIVSFGSMETPIMYTQGLESEKLLFDFSKKWCTNKTQSDK